MCVLVHHGGCGVGDGVGAVIGVMVVVVWCTSLVGMGVRVVVWCGVVWCGVVWCGEKITSRQIAFCR